MTKFEPTKEVLKNPTVLRNIITRTGVKCSYCYSTNMNKQTLSCNDCGTTMPRNYGAHQTKDRHGNKL